MSPLEELLARVSIEDVWQALGLPGLPKRSMKSPFREDKSPSFSVFGDRWKDHASGEQGDKLDLVCKALNIDLPAASKWLLERFGGQPMQPLVRKEKDVSRPTASKPEPLQPCKLESTIRGIHKPTENELERLCELRNYCSIHGLRLMANRRMLVCGEVRGEPVWAVLDGSHNNVRFRRFRQGAWPKSQSVTGSRSDWIIAEPEKHDIIVLTEGEADCLAAACLMAWDFVEHPDIWKRLCGKIGFGFFTNANEYHPECLFSFKDKCVLICPQNERPSSGKPGLKMALNLAKQLDQHGAQVSFWIPPKQGMDLNDYAEQFSEGDTLENSQAFARLPSLLQ